MKLIHKFKSLNYDKRNNKRISFLILHYTALPSVEDSIKHLCDKKNKVSCHYIISQNGNIYNLVSEKHRAWHAGQSTWLLEKDLNSASIGIELDFSNNNNNNKFSKLLINSLISLLKYLKKKYKIDKKNILGHSDIAPLRKKDPGEKFPWKKLSEHNLGKWYKKIRYNLDIKTNRIEVLFFRNLKKIGYKYFSIQNRNTRDKKVVISFQQHYLPSNVTGNIDKKTLKISHFLTK